jgi:hypothetical protein
MFTRELSNLSRTATRIAQLVEHAVSGGREVPDSIPPRLSVGSIDCIVSDKTGLCVKLLGADGMQVWCSPHQNISLYSSASEKGMDSLARHD